MKGKQIMYYILGYAEAETVTLMTRQEFLSIETAEAYLATVHPGYRPFIVQAVNVGKDKNDLQSLACYVTEDDLRAATMDIEKFLEGYTEAALWSSSDWSNVQSDENPDGEINPIPLDENYTVDDISPLTLKLMREDCEAFILANAADLAEYENHSAVTSAFRAGVDFWLSRNGHGAGFFDMGPEAVFERLQQAAREAGEVNLYVGADGMLYTYI
jgi:hypothetical protein